MTTTKKNVCRMCAFEKMDVYVNILDTCENKRSTVEILQSLAGVQANKKDGRSIKICVGCFGKLENYEKLRISVVKAQEKMYGPKVVKNLKYLDPSAPKMQGKGIDDDIAMVPNIKCRQCLSTFPASEYEAHVCSIQLCFQCRSKYACKCQEESKTQRGRKRTKLMEKVACHHCDLEFPDPEVMVAHLMDIARCSIFSCKYCPSYYDEHAKLKAHMEEEHSKKPETDNE